jgi:hypothetical protein
LGTIVHDPESISTGPIYKIWFYIYLLNRLGSMSPSSSIRAKWAE